MLDSRLLGIQTAIKLKGFHSFDFITPISLFFWEQNCLFSLFLFFLSSLLYYSLFFLYNSHILSLHTPTYIYTHTHIYIQSNVLGNGSNHGGGYISLAEQLWKGQTRGLGEVLRKSTTRATRTARKGTAPAKTATATANR